MKYVKFPFFVIKMALVAIRSSPAFGSKTSLFFTLVSLRFKELFFRSNQKCSATVMDYKVTGYAYNSISYLFHEVFLSNEYSFEAGNVSPLILDCGANIGFSVLYFKKLFPASRILAFEPNPDSFALLEKNVLDNKLTDIRLFNIGLADTETMIPFYYNTKGSVSGSLFEQRGGENKIMVQCSKLSSFLKENAVVELVKIDVEGAEHAIIHDLVSEGVLGHPRQYIIEYHHNIGNSSNTLPDFLNRFEKAGYKYSLKANFQKPGDFQDLIIHFIKN